MNERRKKIIIFAATAAIHIFVILFVAFDAKVLIQETSELARIMKMTDLAELPPPPPPDPDPEIPDVEEIAEVMIETDTAPVQNVVGVGMVNLSFDDYLAMHMVSVRPGFDENAITSSLVYPPIALRSGVEGRVILELFVDRTGVVQRITILREEPEGRGFGEAAVKAFTGRKGTPAYANGEAVSCRYRYPVSFRIK
jgi:protein TonB